MRVLALELREQVTGHFAQNVDQHIETAAMGHADDDFLHAFGTGALNQFVNRRNQTLATFERKTLLTDIARVQIFFQMLGFGELLQNATLVIGIEIRR